MGKTDQSEIKAFLPSVYAGCRGSFGLTHTLVWVKH